MLQNTVPCNDFTTSSTLLLNKKIKMNIVQKVRQELIDSSDEKTRQSSQHFFKEEVKTYGVKAAGVVKIAKENFKNVKDAPKLKIFTLCDELWKSGYLEESFIACSWSYHIRKRFEPDDFKVFDKWVNTYVNSWASCDTLCNHTVGEFIEIYPEFLAELKAWAKSTNRWVRRASAVSLIIPARKGLFLDDIFEIANILLPDNDDMVQKGYGWMLKSASKPHQAKVFEYVMSKKDVMLRTALRYAIEKMPPELRATAMAK